jgi:hypothetical protein
VSHAVLTTGRQARKTWTKTNYKPMVGGRRLYLKFTLDETGAFLLTSFKQAGVIRVWGRALGDLIDLHVATAVAARSHSIRCR